MAPDQASLVPGTGPEGGEKLPADERKLADARQNRLIVELVDEARRY